MERAVLAAAVVATLQIQTVLLEQQILEVAEAQRQEILAVVRGMAVLVDLEL